MPLEDNTTAEGRVKADARSADVAPPVRREIESQVADAQAQLLQLIVGLERRVSLLERRAAVFSRGESPMTSPDSE